MRVGLDLISERGTPGGVHTYANRLIEALAGLSGAGGRDVEFVVLANDDYGWLFPAPACPALRIVRSGRSGAGAARRRLLQQTLVPSLVRRERLDLLHSVNNVLPLRTGVPAVLTVHDLSPFELPGRFGAAKAAFLRFAVPRSVRAARRTIAVSESTRTDILRWVRGADPRRIDAVPEAAGPEFHPGRDPEAEASLGGRLGLPREFALTVAAAEPGKNHLAIAAALELLSSRDGLRVPWAVAGASGEGGRRLVAGLKARLGAQVIDLGIVPAADLPHLYRMATCFLFPSLYEGFGLPVLEALASGAPVITSRGGALSEVAGRAALRVDPRDAGSIARAIRRAWRSPGVRSLLAERGTARAREFSWKATAERTLAAYRRALGD
jgi:glycosyltransferase involved in cell wall biosynthesis